MPEILGAVFVAVAFGLLVGSHRLGLTRLQSDIVLIVFLLAFVSVLYLLSGAT